MGDFLDFTPQKITHKNVSLWVKFMGWSDVRLGVNGEKGGIVGLYALKN